jgi:hypothetical protein
MAQKRMFDKRVVESDKFTDLPNSSKALYFMAGMSADDKGFFQPRRLQKMHGFTDDDFKILIAKGYFIPFESGVVVITDWNKNNWLDSRRVTETEYIEELKLLKLINEKYELINDENTTCLANAKPMLRENSIEENNKKENNKKKKYGEFLNVLLTDEEYNKLDNNNLLDYIDRLSTYIESTGKKYKSHYATILNWSRKENKTQKKVEDIYEII